MAKHNFLLDLFNVIAKANRIKQDPVGRAKSIQFGISSIVFSVIAVIFATLAAFLLSLLANGNSGAVILLIFVIAGIAVCGFGAVFLFGCALIRVIAQLSINRRAISWIALAILILCVAAAVLAFFIFL